MKTSYRQIGELIGVLSVVASLLFLSAQLILDRRVALGAQYHERMVLGQDFYLSLSENESWISAEAKQWENGFLPGYWNPDIEIFMEIRELSMEDVVRIDRVYRSTLVRLNNNYYQFYQGLLDGDTPESIRNGLRSQMGANPLYRAIALDFAVGSGNFQDLIYEVEEELKQRS